MPYRQLLLLVLSPLVLALPSLLGSPADLLAVASVLVVSTIALLLVRRPPDRSAAQLRVLARTLRERAQRSAFLRTRDPDADGRPRPRAPGRSLTAA